MNVSTTQGSQLPPNPFRTLDKSGKPVLRRFSTASAVREVYKVLQDQDARLEAPRRAKIKRMYEYFRPYDPEKQAAAGIKDGANVNLGGLAGQIDARAGAINDMALDTTSLVELRPLVAEVAGPDAERIADVVAEEFSVVLRESRRFLPVVASMVKEADLYGLGPVTWRDPYDYQPVALERGQVKIPDDASPISSENDLIMVETTLPAWYLIRLLDEPDVSEAAGWDTNVVRAYLRKIFLDGADTKSQASDETGTSAVESIQAEMRQNRLYEVRQFETIRVVHAFVREVVPPRHITHYIVPTIEDPDGFLFVKEQAYENMDGCLLWLPYSATEKYARALRGLASKLLPTEDLRNRNFCKIVDAATRAAMVKLESTTVGEGLRNTVVEQGPYMLFTGGVKPSNARIDPDFTQLAAVNEMISRVSVNSVLGAAGPAAVTERVYSGADRKTKDQVRTEAEVGAKAEQALFVLRSMVFDALFRECFRRFMNLVLDRSKHDQYDGVRAFIKKCEMREVTVEQLRQIPEQFSVYMCRDLVTGGAGAKAGILADILTLGGNLDEKGRLDATHDYIRCRAGTKAAQRYRPAIGRDAVPGDAASHALLENNAMMSGSPALVGSDQLHWAHIAVHNQPLTQIVEAVQSGQVQDPTGMLRALQGVSEHVQRHIEYGGRQIGKDDDAKSAMAALRGLRPVVQALTMMVAAQEREAEAEAERQQKETEDLRKRAEGQEAAAQMHESDNKAAVKMREVELMHQARLVEAQSKGQVAAYQARSKAAVDRISAQYRMLTEAAKTTGNQPPDLSPLGAGEGQDSLAFPAEI